MEQIRLGNLLNITVFGSLDPLCTWARSLDYKRLVAYCLIESRSLNQQDYLLMLNRGKEQANSFPSQGTTPTHTFSTCKGLFFVKEVTCTPHEYTLRSHYTSFPTEKGQRLFVAISSKRNSRQDRTLQSVKYSGNQACYKT